MKKILALTSALLFLTLTSVKAETGLALGITGAVHYIEADGEEVTRQSGEINAGSHNETVYIPEIFLETVSDDVTLGIAYIPTRELSKSRTDVDGNDAAENDDGTYTGKAEFENVVQLYSDIKSAQSIAGFPIHYKVGVQRATIKSLSSLNSGSVYPEKNLFGWTLGVGTMGDLPIGNNLFYKAEVTYTDFEGLEAISDGGNKVEADLTDMAAKLSVGVRF